MWTLRRKSPSQNLMPEGYVALLFIQIVCTLSYSVLYSSLVLYMKDKLELPVHTANSIAGVFIAFNYALHLLGGFWGGRVFSNRLLFCIGMMAQVVGCFLLSVNNVNFLYYGLAAFLTGSGLNVTCLNCMITQRFAPNDTRRETAFFWSYSGMNIGFFIGYSLSGFFQMTQNYQRLFLLSSLGNLIALLICLYCWHQVADHETIFSKKDKLAQKKSMYLGILGVFCLPLLLTQLIHYAELANKLVLFTGVAMTVLILYIGRQQPLKEAKNKIIAFAILMVVNTIFWMLYQIGPMGLTLFINNNVQREFGSLIIPPQWFQNLNTVAIVIGGPLLSHLFNNMRQKGIQINIPAQFALALFCIGASFALLPVSIYYANASGLINPSWIVLSFILQSIGELLISPVGYAMIGSLAPASMQGVMMGMWMMNTGVGATLSSYSSNLMISNQQSSAPLLTNSGYGHVFLMLGLLAIGSSLILLVLMPKLKELMYGNKSAVESKADDLIIEERVVM